MVPYGPQKKRLDFEWSSGSRSRNFFTRIFFNEFNAPTTLPEIPPIRSKVFPASVHVGCNLQVMWQWHTYKWHRQRFALSECFYPNYLANCNQVWYRCNHCSAVTMLHAVLQAFCLPIIQTVFETLRDIKEGKGSKSATVLEGAGSAGNELTFYCI